MAPPNLDNLPGELVLHIISYLDPYEAVKLQLVSKHLRSASRDASFWRARCYEDSLFEESLARRQRLFGRPSSGSRSSSSGSEDGGAGTQSAAATGDTGQEQRKAEKIRLMANWDPTFPGEEISWYDEYIQRNAPIAVNWLEMPRRFVEGVSPDNADLVEVRGVALYWPDGTDHSSLSGPAAQTLLAVAPLEDGSVCLWDVNGTIGRRGAIVKRSAPRLLFASIRDTETSQLSEHVEFTITECVSVDSSRHLAFFAFQNRLVEVHLQTLTVAGTETFPWSVTALSASHPNVPLTVGMDMGIHMHDIRTRTARTAAFRSVDVIADSIYDARYAPHPQPGPLSILHLQRPGSEEDISDDIYAAGRIPSILHYDRRNLSAIKDTIHSGASLSSLTSIPHPFSTLDYDLRRQGLLSLAQIEKSKSAPGGRTIVACGEYKSKGSLELYGIGPAPNSDGAEYQQNATMKNRQTSSFSKVFSVATHGTRLAISDGAGLIKWFERDGFTEARRCNIGGDEHDEDEEDGEEPSSSTANSSSTGDIARKLMPTRSAASGHARSEAESSFANNELLFWTGEKLGLVSFSSQPGFRSDDFVEIMKTKEERATEREGKAYRTKMRQLFNDVRSARYFGLGSI